MRKIIVYKSYDQKFGKRKTCPSKVRLVSTIYHWPTLLCSCVQGQVIQWGMPTILNSNLVF